MNDIVKKNLIMLIDNSINSLARSWQSIEINQNNPIVEITDLFFQLKSIDNAIEYFNPDLPWAEDHFIERINGKPINPGNQYLNWPYYLKGINNDELFLKDGKFSHNYMERYWCKGFSGIRYDYGDLNDIIERLKNDQSTRQAYLSVWHPEDQSNNNVRVPCTIGYWFKKNNDKLDLTFLIRSCDAIRHYRNDLYMSYRLLQYVSDSINVNAGDMNIWIGSLHCFKSDLYSLKKLTNK